MRNSFLHLLSPLLALVAAVSSADAHQIPSIGLEADIQPDTSCRLLVNLDPRLFLSQQPATLPPIAAQWYRDMSPEDIANTSNTAAKYIAEHIDFRFNDKATTISDWKFLPMDGGTNEPLKPESTEVHLLADVTVKLPAGSTSFGLSLNNKCAAALTMLTAINGRTERRPQVIFPGETSRPIKWESPAAPAVQATSTAQLPPAAQPSPTPPFVWYDAPLQYGSGHVFSLTGWSHFVFLMALAVGASSFRNGMLLLATFHLVHLISTYGCAINNTVVPQPFWLWPLLSLAWFACRGRPWTVSIAVVSVLAVLHSLNEWPHAATPPVIAALETGFALAQFIAFVPLAWIVSRLLSVQGTKKDGQ